MIFKFTYNLSSRTTALGLTQSLKKLVLKNLSGFKARLTCKADNLTAISVKKM
jgi:hypothetical protein